MPLTASHIPLHPSLIHLHDPGLQPHLNEMRQSAVAYGFSDNSHAWVVGDGVGIIRKIDVNDFGGAGVHGIRDIINRSLG